MRLSPGQSHTLEVDPRPYYVDTEIDMAPGEIYDFSAKGCWKDKDKACGPDGWSEGIFSSLVRFNRVAGRNYFELCGSLGESDDAAFPIGPALAGWRVPADAGSGPRRLHLFANDWRIMYGNNDRVPDDPLRATITRIA
jgi:hypothetical protein